MRVIAVKGSVIFIRYIQCEAHTEDSQGSAVDVDPQHLLENLRHIFGLS
jgi:hypothetical protein